MEVYVGQQPDGPFKVSNSPGAVVQRLYEPIKGTGRNVTMDNWFTSLDLLEKMHKDKLSLLETSEKINVRYHQILLILVNNYQLDPVYLGFEQMQH